MRARRPTDRPPLLATVEPGAYAQQRRTVVVSCNESLSAWPSGADPLRTPARHRIITLMDAVDERIVSHLRDDARASFAEIGAVVGLSAPAVKRRVDRLRARGVIRGFTARVDRETLGWATEAYVEVFCQGTVAPDELRRSLERIPEVFDACTVTGDADALLHLLAADITHLEAAIERVRRERNVNHTRSVIVLSRLIDRAPA